MNILIFKIRNSYIILTINNLRIEISDDIVHPKITKYGKCIINILEYLLFSYNLKPNLI